MTYSDKVDFHSHYLPPTYYEYLGKYEGNLPDKFKTPQWNEKSHLDLMTKLGIAFAFVSISSPNLSKADKETEIKMVRKINIEGKEFADRYPDKIGLFASLPLPHIEKSIEEAKYALDVLNADGFGLSTNYSGLYLGDEKLAPLMEFLNERRAVVAVHPVTPADTPYGANGALPIPTMEFFIDTTRTFTNMVMNNTFERYPNIKWIFPHAGAFLTILSDRFNGFSVLMKSTGNVNPLDYVTDMNHVYFDVAGFPLQKQLNNLLMDVKPRNLLYGSDSPYTPDIACIALSGGLEMFSGMSQADKEAVFFKNAVSIIPRLADILGVTVNNGSVCYADLPLTHREKTSRAMRKVVAKLYKRIFG